METISFTPSAEKRLKLRSEGVAPLLLLSVKHFTAPETEACLSSNRKFFAFNKAPLVLKVVQRMTAKHADLEMASDILDIQFIPSPDKLAVLTKSSLVIVTVSEGADQSVQLSQVAIDVENPKWVRPISQTQVAVLTNTKLLCFQVTEAGPVLAPLNLTVSADSEKRFLSASVNHSVLALPSADGSESVQLIDATTFTSILPKEWYPHGDDQTDAVKLLEASTHSTGALRLITYSSANSEVRLWSVVKGSGPTLQQSITIGGEKSNRRLVLDNDSAYFTIFSSDSPSVLIFELSPESEPFAVRRLTEWDGVSGFFCGALFVRKVNQANKLRQELTLLARSAERIVLLGFDPERLDGEPNIGERAKETKPATDNVTKWFGASTSNSNAEGPVVAISSSSGKQVSAAAAESARAEAAQQVAQITENVRQLLEAVKVAVEGLQPVASQNLSTLQQADLLDRSDALALQSAVGAALKPGAANEGGRDKLRSFYSAIGESIHTEASRVATTAMKESLKKQVAITAQNISNVLGAGAKQQDIQIPKLASTDSMKAFLASVDKAHSAQNNVIKAEIAKFQAQCNDIVASAKKKAAATTNTSRVHIQSINTSFAELGSEIAALVQASKQRAAGVPQPAAQKDATAIFEKSKVLAKAGSWEDAFANILEAANLSLLAQFLEMDEVVQNRQRITGPQILSFPVVHAFCQQLCHNIGASAGLIALRVGWLHDILVGWDERFNALKEGKDKDSAMFQRCSYDFQVMSNTLQGLQANQVDNATRRQLTLVKRLLNQLAN